MDCVKEDMRDKNITEQMSQNRAQWRRLVHNSGLVTLGIIMLRRRRRKHSQARKQEEEEEEKGCTIR